jgi:hypothetical protein
MKAQILTATGAAALLMLSQAAQANTLVSTIVGAYDNGCNSVGCLPSAPGGISHFATNGGNPGDSPNLFIYNPTGTSYTNVSLTLTGYNGINNGVSEIVPVADIAAHTAYRLTWGTGSTLFVYDYDDSKNSTGHAPGPVTTGSKGAPVCSAVGGNLCAQVGNFDVKFSAMLGATSISSNFSDNPAGQNGSPYGNVPNTFVPWEGISPQGWSESLADNHSGSTPGTLANIFTGTNQTGGTPTPEPATLALFGAGLGALALTRRRRKSV